MENNALLIKNVILLDKSKKDIYVENGYIIQIADKINKKVRNKINCYGKKAILPGLINGHAHSGMSFLQGYADDLPLKEWLEKKIWPAEKKMNPEDIYWAIKLACLKMIKTGTTCFNDMYWMPRIAIKAITEMGLRAVIGLPLIDIMPGGDKKVIERNWETFKIYDYKNISFSIAPHAIYTVCKPNLIWARDFAKKNNLLLHIHLSETEKEVNDCVRKYGMRPVEYLDKIGFLSKNCVLAHSIWLSDKEINILKIRKCSVVYNPCSNMKLGSGIFPYSKLSKANVNICIGTDSSASNNNLDLFEEMKFASLLQKAYNKDSAIMSAKKIFDITTQNAAKALRINTGTIKIGKLADLILIDLKNICLTPNHNLLSNVVYSCNGDCVSDVICNGKVLMRNRRIKNENEIIRQAQKRIKKLFNKDKGRSKKKNKS